MLVAVVKELKQGEGRVACTPENVRKLTDAGHKVIVEKNAGIGSGFSDDMYEKEGAKIVTHEQAWEADLVIKVKEPHTSEYQYFKKDQIIWGFLHLASSKEIVEKMQEVGVTAISGETIIKNGKAELLAPMSAIAGQRSAIMGAYYSEAQHGGQGTLVTGVHENVDIPGSTYVIFGGGVAATNAANVALGLNAKVIIIELNDDRIKYLQDMYAEKDVTVVKSTPELVTREMVKSMKKGSVLIDIAIDQGGTIETIRPTTISDPVYEEEGVIHYGVPNQPGAVPRTSTMALAQGNIDYILEICDKGLEQAIKDNEALSTGVNIYQGQVTNQGLATSHDLDYKEILNVIEYIVI